MNEQVILSLTDGKLVNLIKENEIPLHIAIIMDGNGRWAKLRNLPRSMGHRQGMEALKDVIHSSCDIGVKYLTLFAFSTENWKRPDYEINALMALMAEYIERFLDDLNKNNIKIAVLGDITPLSHHLKNKVSEAVELTFDNKGLQLNIALNYGARSEILIAVKKIVEEIKQSKISVDELDESKFGRYLYTHDIPDPDLIIRTGGELRLSNFLLYQAAYSELLFTGAELLWPDFKVANFFQSILEFQRRQRRFGKINIEQGS